MAQRGAVAWPRHTASKWKSDLNTGLFRKPYTPSLLSSCFSAGATGKPPGQSWEGGRKSAEFSTGCGSAQARTLGIPQLWAWHTEGIRVCLLPLHLLTCETWPQGPLRRADVPIQAMSPKNVKHGQCHRDCPLTSTAFRPLTATMVVGSPSVMEWSGVRACVTLSFHMDKPLPPTQTNKYK